LLVMNFLKTFLYLNFSKELAVKKLKNNYFASPAIKSS